MIVIISIIYIADFCNIRVITVNNSDYYIERLVQNETKKANEDYENNADTVKEDDSIDSASKIQEQQQEISSLHRNSNCLATFDGTMISQKIVKIACAACQQVA